MTGIFFSHLLGKSSFSGTKVQNSQNASDYTVNEKSRNGEQGSKIRKKRKRRHKIHLGEIRRWIFFPPSSFIISVSSATNNCLALYISASHLFGAAKPPPKKKKRAKGANVEQWIMMHGE